MTSFGLFVVCVQAFLVQNVISQYLGPARYDTLLPGVTAPIGAGCRSMYGLGADVFATGITGYSAATTHGLGAEIIAPGWPTNPAAYGGTGIGDVAVAGEMPVAGTTFVAGQVPVIGVVHFVGELPAAGIVSVIGNCGCGCGSSMFY